ncbi:MAG: hypothetical protein N3B18_01975 [Desulfobacterota bacterium]|nr:hypothetical protein [Thermodesulfobacteriota bacterium]
MKKLIIFILTLIFGVFTTPPVSLSQQYWAKAYGEAPVAEWGDHILQTQDGGLVIAGGATDLTAYPYETDMLFLKLDAQGTVQWSKVYGFAGREDWVQSVQQTRDGGYITLCTSKLSASEWDVFMVKLDSSGDILWQKKIISNTPYSIWVQHLEETPDGGYMVDGDFNAPSGSTKDFFLMKLDAQGNILWNKVTGGGDYSTREYWTHLYRQTADGGFIGSGADWTLSTMSNDLLLRRYDSQGNVVMERTYGERYRDGFGYLVDEWGVAVRQAYDTGFAVAGPYVKIILTPPYPYERDFFIIRTDRNGNLLWEKRYGIDGVVEDAQDMQQTSDGGFLINGVYESSPGVWDTFIVKTDTDGSIQWQKSLRGEDPDTRVSYVASIREAYNGGYYLFGDTYKNGTYNKFLLKLTASGNIQWQKKFVGGAAGYWLHTVIQKTSDNGFIFTGQTWAFGTYTDDVFVMDLNAQAEISDCPKIIIDGGAINLIDTPFVMTPIDAVEQDVYLPEYTSPLTITTTHLLSRPPAFESSDVCEEDLITLAFFDAYPANDHVDLVWITEGEMNNAGFNLYRSSAVEGMYTKINPALIPATGSLLEGAGYRFRDSSVSPGKTYYYILESIDTTGELATYGPVSAHVPDLMTRIKRGW